MFYLAESAVQIDTNDPDVFPPNKHHANEMPTVQFNNSESLHILFMSAIIKRSKTLAILALNTEEWIWLFCFVFLGSCVNHRASKVSRLKLCTVNTLSELFIQSKLSEGHVIPVVTVRKGKLHYLLTTIGV